jgi:UDP-glucose 4-epimerase
VGSNLTRVLIGAEASKIVIVDDLSAAAAWNIPVDTSVIFVKGSILEEGVLKQAFADRPDFVFHLAAHFANQNSVDNPETDQLVNGLGTLKVLEHARVTGVKKFVYASSGCSVYGSQAPLPLKEDFVSLHLDTPYQITKLLGELYCNFFFDYYKLPVAIARYFNVYGPGEIPGAYRNVIPNFIWWAMHRRPLPITGTGDETRDFTYVDDIIAGTLLLGVVPEAVGNAFNLASETETKVKDIAAMVNEITGNDKGMEMVPRRDWDKIVRRRASIAKARKVLGYQPRTAMQDGMKKVYDWITENKSRIEVSARF